MESPQEEKTIYELFRISIVLKGLISIAEVIVGALILFTPSAWIVALAARLAAGAALQGGGAILSRIALELSTFTAATATFLGLYLLSRGLIKTVLITGLFKNQLWAFPASIGVLGLFLIYQFYQIITVPSIFVVGLTIFDLVVLYLIWREYRILRTHLALNKKTG
jgi:uncharacterized membrane protein